MSYLMGGVYASKGPDDIDISGSSSTKTQFYYRAFVDDTPVIF